MQEEKENKKESSIDTNNEKENKDASSEVKNANASGLGSLGRSDETIEKTEKDKKSDDSIPY